MVSSEMAANDNGSRHMRVAPGIEVEMVMNVLLFATIKMEEE